MKLFRKHEPLFLLYENFIPLTEKSCPDIIPGRYKISNYGRVLDLKRNEMVNQNCQDKPMINLYTKDNILGSYWIDELTKLEFEGPDPDPNKIFIIHKDFNDYNHRLENLEWVDGLTSCDHSIIHKNKFVDHNKIDIKAKKKAYKSAKKS